MSDAPERIWVWTDVAPNLAGTWGVTRYPVNAVAYVRADALSTLQSRVAELEAANERYQEALRENARLFAEARAKIDAGKDQPA